MLAIYKIIFKIQRSLLGGTRKLLRKAKQHSNFIRFSQAFCLACIHWDFRFLRFISKHLLIQMCIWGDGFRVASQKAYFLLMRHPNKTKRIDFISTFILFQTKVKIHMFSFNIQSSSVPFLEACLSMAIYLCTKRHLLGLIWNLWNLLLLRLVWLLF